ncbi:MAG: hypothetical protein KC464_13430 [Myxococcales bacterium]|nr:hypothetical protein [Myxococcales bacterium]
MRAIVPLLSLAALLPAASAAAENYYWHEGSASPPKASYVYRYAVRQPCGTLRTYKTTDLSPGADTVMHLTIGGEEVAWNDNFGGLRSQITYYAACSRGSQSVSLWVRAASNASGGDPDLGYTFRFWDGTRDLGVHNLGGYLLTAGGALNTQPSDTMETVLTNNGAAATLLIRMVWDTATPQHYRIDGYNQTGGVGIASKLGGSNATNELWIVATPTEATREGPVRVVRNDVASSDADGDGLGNALESEACTCPSTGTYWCGVGVPYVCTSTGNSTPTDTDHDGLSDAIELLGKESSGQPTQYLPWWGANPRRRDVFVEMDRAVVAGTAAGVWTSEATAVGAATPFADLSVTNPDGSHGISTHFDIGVGAGGYGCRDENGDGLDNDGDVDGITSFCGNMGGASTLTYAPTVHCEQDLANMDSVRLGMFRWMVRWAPWNGSTPAPLCSYIGNSSDAIRLVAHELGHQLGLGHNGDSNKMNRNPIYQSLMNYTYTSSFYVDNDPGPGQSLVNRPQFSSGSLAAWPLDPSAVSETVDYGAGAPLDFMTTSISGYDYDVDPNNPQHVDWNRDGRFDGSVRAHVIGEPNRRDFGGASLPQQVDSANLPPVSTGASVGATYAPTSGTTYVVATDLLSGRLVESRRRLGAWSSWAELPESPTFWTQSSPAAATYDLDGTAELTVFAAGTDGTVYFAGFDDGGGLVSPWQVLPAPAGVSFREVNVTVADGRLYVIGADQGTTGPGKGQVWLGWFDGAQWSGFALAEIGGVPVVSMSSTDSQGDVVTPGLAQGPEGAIYVHARSPSATYGADGLRLYRFDPTDGHWEKAPAAPRGTNSCSGPTGRVTMVYRAHRAGDGSPLPSGTGAFWTWYSTTCNDGGDIKNETFYRWTWGELSAEVQAFDLGKWHRTSLGNGSCSHVWRNSVGRGVGLVDHPDGLTALVAHTPSGSCSGGVWWVPHADGEVTPPEPVKDFDDGAFISTNLCSRLHAYDGGCTKCAGTGVQCAAPPPFEPTACYDDEEYVAE